MKNGKFLWSRTSLRAAGILVLALAALFAACDNPTTGTPPGPGVTVTSVTVSPNEVEVAKGGGQQFTATVAGTGSPAQTVTWSVEGAAEPGTTINGSGVLAVDADEPEGASLTITATSTVDNTKSGTATITVSSQTATVSGVTVSPDEATVAKGKTYTFTATVAGDPTPMQTVTWSIVESVVSGTAIDAHGVLTIASGEIAGSLTVKATSVLDGSKSGTATVTVVSPELTITGLGGIFKENSHVYVGVAESNVIDLSSGPGDYIQGTITDGSLTITLETLESDSCYIGFSAEGVIFFMSKATADFSGGIVSIAYNTNNFELYTHSLKGSDMGLSSSMSLQTIIQGMSEGEMNNYAEWKIGMKAMVEEEIGDKYVDLDNVNILDIALYKNETCTLQFNDSDTVGPNTLIYTKFSLASMMGGGDNDQHAVGYIKGTVSFINKREGAKIHIFAVYDDGKYVDDIYPNRYPDVKDNGSFSLPFTQTFLTALESGSQNIVFNLWIEEPGSGGGYFKFDIDNKTLTEGSLDGSGNLNVTLGTVTLASTTITLSGTVSLTYNEAAVPYAAITVVNDDTNELLGHAKTQSSGSNAPWSLILPAFISPTTIRFDVQGFSEEPWDGWLFAHQTDVTVSDVHNTDVPNVTIDLGNITTP